jgi:hypothetical protein
MRRKSRPGIIAARARPSSKLTRRSPRACITSIGQDTRGTDGEMSML